MLEKKFCSYTSDTAIRDLLTEILSPKFLSRGSMKQFSSLIAVSSLRGDTNGIFFHERQYEKKICAICSYFQILGICFGFFLNFFINIIVYKPRVRNRVTKTQIFYHQNPIFLRISIKNLVFFQKFSCRASMTFHLLTEILSTKKVDRGSMTFHLLQLFLLQLCQTCI